MKRTSIAVLGLGVVVATGLMAVVLHTSKRPALSQQPGGVKPQTYVTISKETTYITEPLRNDGYVDYLAAINARCQEGVTLENNAAIPFLKAMWPAEIPPRHRETYCRMLGIEVLPEQGDYFVKLEKYAQGLKEAERPANEASADGTDAFHKQLTEAMRRPWSKKEFPVLADWLAANEKPLSLIHEASKCSRRYDPLISDDGSVIGGLLSCVNLYREAVRTLTARAMLRLGDGKTDEAWEDLLACHRLARLAGQGATLVESLVGIAIEGTACTGDQALLQPARLTAAQVTKIQDDLAKLPSMPKMADKIELGERFMFLDAVAALPRNGLSSIQSLSGVHSPSTIESISDAIANKVIDWDLILRMVNAWYGRIVDAYRKPARVERLKAMQELDEELAKLVKSAGGSASFGFRSLWPSSKAVSERIGHRLLCLFLPALNAGADAEDKEAMQFELTQLAFALAAYHADHGSYPAKLGELSPKYAAKVPEDIFSAAELHYQQEGTGYLLYSVGPNGKDEGGRGMDDRKEGEYCDDIAVRVK